MKISIAIKVFIMLIIPLILLSQQRQEITPRKTLFVKNYCCPFQDEFHKNSEGLSIGNFTNSRMIKNETIFDNGFLLAEKLQYRWGGTEWIIMHKKIYEYDSNYNQIEEIQQYQNDFIWVNDVRTLSIYDLNNNKIEEMVQVWKNSVWGEYEFRTLYIYDSNNNCIMHLHQNSGGVDWSRCFYTYDGKNNITGHIQQLWVDSTWVDYYRHTLITYDANNNLTYVLGQIFTDSNWIDQWTDLYSYDANNNRIENIGSYWNGTKWIYSVKYLYIYDENNNLTVDLRQDWYGSGWMDAYRGLYYYKQITDLKDENSMINYFSLSNNYPNPFNPSTKISWQSPVSCWQTLKVFDILGSKVKTLVDEEREAGYHTLDFDASNLPSGAYFYQLRARSFIETKKMLLLK